MPAQVKFNPKYEPLFRYEKGDKNYVYFEFLPL
jgi:hypothetical protein